MERLVPVVIKRKGIRKPEHTTCISKHIRAISVSYSEPRANSRVLRKASITF